MYYRYYILYYIIYICYENCKIQGYTSLRHGETPDFRPLARTMQAAQRLGYRKRIWQLGKTMADLMGNHGYLIYGYNMFYNCS